MADLSVSNSGYSTGATDTWTAMVNNVTPTDARQPNGLASAILQIEAVLGSGSVLPGSLASLAARLAVQVGTDGIIIPPGAGMDYFGASAPTGWLFRDGSAVSRTTYAALFTAIGTTYGAGDGSTTFNLPDDRHRVTMGAGTGARDGESGSGAITGGTALAAVSIGEWGGSSEVTLTDDQSGLVGHAHAVSTGSGSAGGNVITGTEGATGGTGSTASQAGANAQEAHTNMMPYLVCNKIIKT
jgi:microcystin-dependent protein